MTSVRYLDNRFGFYIQFTIHRRVFCGEVVHSFEVSWRSRHTQFKGPYQLLDTLNQKDFQTSLRNSASALERGLSH